MLILTVEVNVPPGFELAVKEQIAMRLECFGDVRVTKIEVMDNGNRIDRR